MITLNLLQSTHTLAQAQAEFAIRNQEVIHGFLDAPLNASSSMKMSSDMEPPQTNDWRNVKIHGFSNHSSRYRRMKTEDDVTASRKGSPGRLSTFHLSSPPMKSNARLAGQSLSSDEKIIVEGFTRNDKEILSPVDEHLSNVKRENLQRSCSYRNSYHSDTGPNHDVGSDILSLKVQDTEECSTLNTHKSNKSRHNIKIDYSTNAARNESFRVPPRSQSTFKSRSRSLERFPRKTHRLSAVETSHEPMIGQDDSLYLAKQDFNRFQPGHVPIKASTSQLSGIPFVCGMRKQSPHEHLGPCYVGQQDLELDTPYHAFSFRGNGHAHSNRHLTSPMRFSGDQCARLNSRHHKQSFSQGSPQQRYSAVYDDSHHLLADDEEPVWKQYQWYRDKKRPNSRQTRQQRAEQTIFMQYNEIRHKRFSRGRVVNGLAAPGPAPLPHFHGDKNAPLPSCYCDSSCYSSGEEDNSTSACFRRRFDGVNEGRRGHHGLVAGIAQSNFEKSHKHSRQETKSKIAEHKGANCTVAFSPEMKSRSSHFSYQQPIVSYSVDETRRSATTAGSDDSDQSPNAQVDEVQEDINSTTIDDAVFFPRRAWRTGNDVAKTMRLNRIVRAMKTVKKRQQSFGSAQDEYQEAKKMKSVLLNNGVEGDSSVVEQTLIGNAKTEKTSEKGQSAPAIDTFSGYSSSKKRLLKARNQVRCWDLSSVSDVSTSGSDQESLPANGLTAGSVSDAGDDEDVVCQVNGLLALPGFKETKFNITLGELKRRVSPPETLTRVEMISYVRQAKSSGRILLDNNNITTANRSHPTILSRVCEGEAQILADRIHKMNKHYLPLTTLARKTVDTYKDHSCEVKDCDDCRLKLRRRIVDVEITRNSLRELHKSIEDMRKEDELKTFELASHNFGVANICNNLSLLDEYFKVLLLTLQDE